MDLTLEFKGIDKLMAANQSYARRFPNVVLNAIRRPLRRTVTKIRQRIRKESGIGKSIWGRHGKAKGLETFVREVRTKVVGTSIHAGIRLTGLAAMIEQGGKIKPHLIKIKAHPIKNAFGFRGTIQHPGMVVKHPGASVRAHFFAQREMAGISSQVVEAIRQDLEKLKVKTFGQAA